MDDLLIINKAAALERLDSDEALYQEVVEVFCEDTPIQLEKLQQAYEAKVVSEVTRISHSLKSAAANIGGDRMSAASKRAEMASKTGSLDGLAQLIGEIRKEFEAITSQLGRK